MQARDFIEAINGVLELSLDEGYHSASGKFNSGHEGARLYSRKGQRFRIVTREGRHWKVPVRGRLRSQMSKSERRELELRDERRKGLEQKTKLPEGYNDGVDEMDATENPVERESFYAQVIESVRLPKKKWIDTALSKLSEEQLRRLWDLYSISYEAVGKTVKDLSHMRQKYKLLWLIDLDEDVSPDAFIIYKDTKFGSKLSLIGHDGSSAGKRAMLEKAVGLLKTRGWYTGASGRPAEIMIAKGAPIVDDPKIIETVFKHKFIRHIGKGKYEVEVGRGGYPKRVIKSMFGNPIVREDLDEETPVWLKRCVAGVAKGKKADTSRAFAICIAQGQKFGLLEPGTKKPTEKGTSRAKSLGQDPEHKVKMGAYEKLLKGKKKKKKEDDSIDEGMAMSLMTGKAMQKELSKARSGRHTLTSISVSDVERASKADHRKIYNSLSRQLDRPGASVVERERWYPGELDVRILPSNLLLQYRLQLDGVWLLTITPESGQQITRKVGDHRTNEKKIVRNTLKILKKLGLFVEDRMVFRDLKVGQYGLQENPEGLKVIWYEGSEVYSGEIVDSFIHPRLSMTIVKVLKSDGQTENLPANAVRVQEVDICEDNLSEAKQALPANFLAMQAPVENKQKFLAAVKKAKSGTTIKDSKGRILFKKIGRNKWDWYNENTGAVITQTDDHGVYEAVRGYTTDDPGQDPGRWPSLIPYRAALKGNALVMESLSEENMLEEYEDPESEVLVDLLAQIEVVLQGVQKKSDDIQEDTE